MRSANNAVTCFVQPGIAVSTVQTCSTWWNIFDFCLKNRLTEMIFKLIWREEEILFVSTANFEAFQLFKSLIRVCQENCFLVSFHKLLKNPAHTRWESSRENRYWYEILFHEPSWLLSVQCSTSFSMIPHCKSVEFTKQKQSLNWPF